ncbi:MAG: phosphoribosylpyrophosphate synthetase [Chitinophagales bacterium]
MQNYEPTLSETLKKLKAEGYTEDFNLSGDCVHCQSGKLKIFPAEFHIDQYFRFEGQSDPGDAAILYAISSEKYKLKGVLVNGYGIYSEPLTNEMLDKLKTK